MPTSQRAIREICDKLAVRFYHLAQNILWDQDLSKEIAEKAVSEAREKLEDCLSSASSVKSATGQVTDDSWVKLAHRAFYKEIDKYLKNLIDRAKINKEAENHLFDILYKHLQHSTRFKSIRYKINEEDAQDLLFETLKTIYLRYTTAKPQGTYLLWMEKILYNKVGDYFRKNRRLSALNVRITDDSEYPVKDDTQEDRLFVFFLLEAIKKMDKRCKHYFKILIANDSDNVAIYNEYPQIRPETIQTQLSRCRKKLKNLLKDDYYL